MVLQVLLEQAVPREQSEPQDCLVEALRSHEQPVDCLVAAARSEEQLGLRGLRVAERSAVPILVPAMTRFEMARPAGMTKTIHPKMQKDSKMKPR